MHSFIFNSDSGRFLRCFLTATVFVSVIFACATEWLIRAHVRDIHPLNKHIQLLTSKRSPNAIFGDSHAAHGLLGLKSFVNQAFGGEGMALVQTKVEYYFDDLKPATVILQAAPHHFAPTWLDKDREPTPKEFLKMLDDRGYPLEILNPELRREAFAYWRAFLSGKPPVPKESMMDDGARVSDDVYAAIPKSIRLQAARRQAYQIKPVSAPMSTWAAQAYETTVRSLLEKGARICLVTFPVSATLRAELAQFPQYADIFAFFDALAEKNGIPYVNAFSMEMDESLFADSHHLNGEGARMFTRIVADRCGIGEAVNPPSATDVFQPGRNG